MVYNSLLHRLDAVKLHPYSLKANTQQRKGFLVQLTLDGEQGWGDIAPLENWSQESYASALLQAEKYIQGKVNESALLPSVHFGFDCAQRQLLEPHSFQPFTLPLSGLLIGTVDRVKADALSLAQLGIKTAKIKIAPSVISIAEAVALLKELRTVFRLRIDLNRAWKQSDVYKILEHFTKEDFDYIEEPLQDWRDLAAFPFPFALDESLREMRDLSMLDTFMYLKTVIVKPTLIGGLSRINPWKKYPMILSGAYESGVGIWHIAHLAKQLNIADIPIGLDTYRFIENDLLQERIAIVNGHLHISKSLHIKGSSTIAS